MKKLKEYKYIVGNHDPEVKLIKGVLRENRNLKGRFWNIVSFFAVVIAGLLLYLNFKFEWELYWELFGAMLIILLIARIVAEVKYPHAGILESVYRKCDAVPKREIFKEKDLYHKKTIKSLGKYAEEDIDKLEIFYELLKKEQLYEDFFSERRYIFFRLSENKFSMDEERDYLFSKIDYELSQLMSCWCVKKTSAESSIKTLKNIIYMMIFDEKMADNAIIYLREEKKLKEEGYINHFI